MNLIDKIMCKLGFHDWGYQSKDSGIYLHCFFNGTLPRYDDHYTNKRRCWSCSKIDSKWKKL